MKYLSFAAGIILLAAALPVHPQNGFTPFFETEQGTIAVLHHVYQNIETKDDEVPFDFRNQGGQDNLYPFRRYAVGADIAGGHRIWFTYQPLELVTNVTFREKVTVGKEEDTENDELEFDDGTPMKLTYSFPFYRFTYTYDLLGRYDHAVLGLGMVLQIRNASVRFEALDDSGLYVSQNVGLVPALAVYSRYQFDNGLELSADIAGSKIDSAYFNGASFDFSGSILDASLRAGYLVDEHFRLFGTLRFFGGTAEGTSDPEDSWSVSSYNYTKNNIATLTASVGASWTK